MKQILRMLNNLIKVPSTRSVDLPSPFIVSANQREGISPIKITNAVLEKKKELGLVTGTYDDGTPNYDDIIIQEIVTQVVKSIQEDAKITVAIPPGIPVTASGGNAGGPLVAQGSTVSFARGGAIIQ